jgi:hypothetical protein
MGGVNGAMIAGDIAGNNWNDQEYACDTAKRKKDASWGNKNNRA